MTTADILTAAQALIEPPGSWCKHASARNAFGTALSNVKAGEAVSWCSSAAIRVCTSDPDEFKKARKFLQSVTVNSVVSFNDDPATTHAMVLDAFDAAIEKARANG